MKQIGFILIVGTLLIPGCSKPNTDDRILVREDVASDTIGHNIVTKPIKHAFSALVGDGIEITEAVTRRNDAGFLELYVMGFNKAYDTKRFQYKVEWLDADGLLIETKASTWKLFSATGKNRFSITERATRTNAADFRMDTRKWE